MSKILIVEDDLSIQALLHDFIQEAGYSVTLAADGVEALAKYSEQTFDLILLDIMLPKLRAWICKQTTILQNRQTGGTGLGLYIVKTILDLHGAEIRIGNTSQGVIVSVQF